MRRKEFPWICAGVLDLRQGTYSNIRVHAGGNWLAASGDSKSIDTCRYAGHCVYFLVYGIREGSGCGVAAKNWCKVRGWLLQRRKPLLYELFLSFCQDFQGYDPREGPGALTA